MGTVSTNLTGSDPIAALLSVAPVNGTGHTLAGLGPLREQARASFLAHGLPTKRDESWRYTDLRRLRDADFRLVTAADSGLPVTVPEMLASPAVSPMRLVFVNGAFRADLSQMQQGTVGVAVQSLAAAFRRGQHNAVIERSLQAMQPLAALPMVALNTALFEDGLVIVAEPEVLDTVWIEAIFIGGGETPVAFAPRHCIQVGEGSRVVLIEQHVSLPGSGYFANAVLQADLQAGAALHHYRLVDCAKGAINALTTAVNVDANASYEGFSLLTGHGFSRLESQIMLNGRKAACTLGSAYHADGDDVCDNTTWVEHRAPQTKSRQVYRGVIDDKAHAVFQGRVLVTREADEADGHQLSKALLLSDEAEIDQKPALEIYADNVKCSHGAATGSLDQRALFYLRSRGLPEEVARQLLVDGFLAEALQEVSLEDIRLALQERSAPSMRQSQP